MSKKYSSDNKMRKLFEGFRGFTEEEPTVSEGNMKMLAVKIMDELQAAIPPDKLPEMQRMLDVIIEYQNVMHKYGVYDIMNRYGLEVEDLQGILQDIAPMGEPMNEGILKVTKNMVREALNERIDAQTGEDMQKVKAIRELLDSEQAQQHFAASGVIAQIKQIIDGEEATPPAPEPVADSKGFESKFASRK